MRVLFLEVGDYTPSMATINIDLTSFKPKTFETKKLTWLNRKHDLIWRRKKLFFHQDNAPVLDCTSLVELGYELLPHSPFTPDSIPNLRWKNFFFRL